MSNGISENRSLDPAMPVFRSESYYERAGDPETAYHTRRQVWTALLNGAAGYGYGAQGVWQFRDPADPKGETGKKTKESVPWREAVHLPGSQQVRHARGALDRVRGGTVISLGTAPDSLNQDWACLVRKTDGG